MHINYTFKVNAYSLEKGVISVTYTPTYVSYGLSPYHIQQLGIDKQILVDYSTGVITLEEFKNLMRKAIIDAGSEPQHHWNEVLASRNVPVPPDINDMVGVEWPVVEEIEVVSGVASKEVL